MNDSTSDEQLLADLGIEVETDTHNSGNARELRIIAGFEEIEKFVELNNRTPEHKEDKDIFERLYAVRLDRIRASEECLSALANKDRFGLLKEIDTKNDNISEELDDESLLSGLGILPSNESDITKLRHVRTRAEIRTAEEIARRTPCLDYESFKQIFIQAQSELKSGIREAHDFKKNNSIKKDDLFIIGGQKALIAEVGEEFIADYNQKNCRLRVIYDNGTESDILMLSFRRALYKDITARRIIDPLKSIPLFSDNLNEEDSICGTIYILRSKSDHPFISKNREVIHKIGVTSNKVQTRISNTELDPTFLMAEVEIVATYELSNISRVKLEGVIHKFFESVRLNIEIKDRFGNPVIPKEWFLVPLFIIDEAIKRIKDGSIVNCEYEAKTGKIIELE